MKTVLIIGMGKTGRHLAARMQELGNDVYVADKNEERINNLTVDVADAKVCDCTNKNVIAALDVRSFDHCFVMIGSDFQSSLVITSLLKTYGAKHVIAKAREDIQYDLLTKIGADEVVRPEVEIANRLAVCYNSGKIFDYIPINEGYAFYEIGIRKTWIGKTLRELDIRKKYNVNIVAIKRDAALFTSPDADFRFFPDDRILVLCTQEEIARFSRGK